MHSATPQQQATTTCTEERRRCPCTRGRACVAAGRDWLPGGRGPGRPAAVAPAAACPPPRHGQAQHCCSTCTCNSMQALAAPSGHLGQLSAIRALHAWHERACRQLSGPVDCKICRSCVSNTVPERIESADQATIYDHYSSYWHKPDLLTWPSLTFAMCQSVSQIDCGSNEGTNAVFFASVLSICCHAFRVRTQPQRNSSVRRWRRGNTLTTGSESKKASAGACSS